MTVSFLIFFWIRSVQNELNLIKLFGQKWLFCRNCFSSKNTFVKFEVAFWPEIAFYESALLLKVLKGLARL